MKTNNIDENIEILINILKEMYYDIEKIEEKENAHRLMFTQIDGKEVENVDSISPSHYKLWDGVEVFDLMKAVMSQERYRGFLEGNVLKYITRWEKKDGLRDLRKGRKYLDMFIQELEKDED